MPVRITLEFALEDHFQPKTGKKVGRPGMPLWNILALALIKMNAKCRFDLLEHWANGDGLLRQFLGHGDLDSHCQYQRSTLIRNLNSLTPKLLVKINLLIVKHGHQMVGHQDQDLAARVDSFAVETDVHYPRISTCFTTA